MRLRGSIQAGVAVLLAGAAASFMVGFPLGSSGDATAAASPATVAPVTDPNPAPAAVPARVVAVHGTVGLTTFTLVLVAATRATGH